MIVTGLTIVAVTYIQSESFAKIAKEKIQKRVAKEMGLELNFDRLKIGVLPPSLSMVNVDVKVMPGKNPLHLAEDTVFRAESLGFSFRMIQAFSRGIAVNKVFLDKGEIRLKLPEGEKNNPKEKLSDLVRQQIKIPLGKGFSASIRQLELRNTSLDLSWKDSGGGPARLALGGSGYLAVTPSACTCWRRSVSW